MAPHVTLRDGLQLVAEAIAAFGAAHHLKGIDLDADGSLQAGPASAAWRVASDRALEADLIHRVGDFQRTIRVWAGPRRQGARVAVIERLRRRKGRPGVPPPLAPPVELVRMLLDRLPLEDGGMVMRDIADSVPADMIDVAVDLLEDETRRRPVLLLTKADGPAARYPIDPDRAATLLAGIVHVLAIDGPAAWKLNECLPPDRRTYGGAARLYWPDFRREDGASAYWTPAALGHDADGILQRIRREAVAAVLVDEDLTSPVARLRGDDAAAWAQRLADLENANRELRRRVRELEDTATRPVQVHATVEEALAAAASKHPELVVTDKARRSARESPYRWPDRVAAAVDAIGQVASRWAAGPMGRSLADAFEELGFTYAPHIGDTTAGMWGDQYEVTHDNVTYPMPGHVKLGVGSAEQCIRIHLAFDEERRQVLIGWAGSHLTNTLTN